MIIDHIGLMVRDYARSKAFYAKALAPLGIELVMDVQDNAGFGRNGKPDFWISGDAKSQGRIHVAFVARDRKQVKAFYDAAIAVGGKDNGPPGIREIYHPNYFGAFVLDPDGHNVEAVCHQSET